MYNLILQYIFKKYYFEGNIPRARGSSSSKSQSVSPNIAVHIDTQLPAVHAVPAASVGEPSPGSARSVGSKRNSPAVNKLLSPDSSISPAAAAGETGKFHPVQSSSVFKFVELHCCC